LAVGGVDEPDEAVRVAERIEMQVDVQAGPLKGVEAELGAAHVLDARGAKPGKRA